MEVTIVIDGVKFNLQAIKTLTKTAFQKKFGKRFKSSDKVWDIIQTKLGKKVEK